MSWKLDQGASSLKFNHFYPITIVFTTKGVVGGNAACHSYSGTYTVDNSDIVISHLSQTFRACSPLATAADHECLSALQAVRHVAPTNRDRLKLTGNSETLSYHAGHRRRSSNEPGPQRGHERQGHVGTKVGHGVKWKARARAVGAQRPTSRAPGTKCARK
jgi:heat shock protein HslJ